MCPGSRSSECFSSCGHMLLFQSPLLYWCSLPCVVASKQQPAHVERCHRFLLVIVISMIATNLAHSPIPTAARALWRRPLVAIHSLVSPSIACGLRRPKQFLPCVKAFIHVFICKTCRCGMTFIGQVYVAFCRCICATKTEVCTTCSWQQETFCIHTGNSKSYRCQNDHLCSYSAKVEVRNKAAEARANKQYLL